MTGHDLASLKPGDRIERTPEKTTTSKGKRGMATRDLPDASSDAPARPATDENIYIFLKREGPTVFLGQFVQVDGQISRHLEVVPYRELTTGRFQRFDIGRLRLVVGLPMLVLFPMTAAVVFAFNSGAGSATVRMAGLLAAIPMWLMAIWTWSKAYGYWAGEKRVQHHVQAWLSDLNDGDGHKARRMNGQAVAAQPLHRHFTANT